MPPFDVMWVLLHSLYFAALAAFSLRLLGKWGVINWYEIHRRRWMPRDCTLCFGWWFGILACLIFGLLWGFDLHLLACLPVIPVFVISLMKR